MSEFMGMKFLELPEHEKIFVTKHKECPKCRTGGIKEGRPRHVPLIDLQIEDCQAFQCQICKSVYIL